MKLSLNWLKDYVNIKGLKEKEIANKLTMTGSKVESISYDGGKINDIVVGKVLNIEKHKDAEKLVICEVLVGNDQILKIITGAQNVVKNSLVPVCLKNSTIFDGRKIKYQKLRGILSEGMMCSLEELGLSTDSFPYAIEDGIFLIQENCSIGQDIKSALSLDDYILDFEITSNRPDCLCVFGLAREVAASFSLELKEISYENLKNLPNLPSPVKVEILTPFCKRYMAQLVENVKIEDSPFWIRNRLRKHNIKSINNVVDITNYVMLELGVPMHAFDADKIKDLNILIRTAKQGETIKTLDNLTHTLNQNDILVCDATTPLSIAGIIGGVDCSVTKATKNVIFEVACFAQENIRKTSKSLNIKTESAIRFEKGLNPKICEESMKRACDLVLDLKLGEIKTKTVDVKNFKEEDVRLKLDCNYINRLLGTDLSKEDMQKILKSLGFDVNYDTILVPDFRVDIKNQADLAEEIARIYGYNKIKSTLLNTSTEKFGLTDKQQMKNLIKNTAISLGLFEIYTFSFADPKLYEKSGIKKEEFLENAVTIKNPFGEETSLMRKFLFPCMLQTLSYNFRNKNENAALFEIAKVYEKNENKISEKEALSIGLYGTKYDFFSLKGMVLRILEKAGIKNCTFTPIKQKLFHPYICCNILKDDIVLGVLGEVNPIICKNFKIFQKAYLAELNYEKIIKNSSKEKKYIPFSKFPKLERDLSLICDENLPCAVIETEIKKTVKNILEKIEVFDVYRSDQLPKNKKSISFKIVMRKPDTTLTEKEADLQIEKILKNLESLNVSLRSF